MSLSVPEFWNAIVEAGLADGTRARKWATQCAADNGGKFPSDAKEVADWLIKSRFVSKYQADHILDGRHEELREGPWVILSPKATTPLSDWFEATHIDQPSTVSCVWRFTELTPLQIGQIKRHIKVKSPLLQPIDLVNDSESVWIATQLPPGELLAAQIERGPLDVPAVARLAHQIALALQSLHQGNIASGEVHPERIWMSFDGTAMLLRDPVWVPDNPFTANKPAVTLDAFQIPRAAFAAPEFAVPGTLHQPATDIYALGCVLYYARHSLLPFHAADFDAWSQAHAREWPPLLPNENIDPVDYLIRHCLAKNNEARFASAASVVAAAQHLLTNPHLLQTFQAPSLPGATNPTITSEEKEKKTSTVKEQVQPESKEPAASIKQPPTTTKLATPAPTVPPATPAAAATTKPAAPKPPAKTTVTPAAAATPAPITSAPKPAAPAKPAATTPPQPTSTLPAPSSDKPAAIPPTKPAPVAAPPPVAAPLNPAPPVTVGATNPAQTAPAANIAVTPPPKRSKKKKKKKKNYAPVLFGAVGIAVLMMMIAILVPRGKSDSKEEEAYADVTPPPTPPPVTNVATATPSTSPTGPEVVNDPNLLWVAPKSDKPIALEMVPAGTQTVFMMRPARLLSQPEGRQLLAQFDPELSGAFQSLISRTGVSAGEVDRLFVAFEEGPDGTPSICLSVTLVAAKPLSELKSKWGKVDAAQTADNQTIFAPEAPTGDAFYVREQPPNDAAMISAFAVGSLPSITKVAEVAGEAIPLPRASEQLWKHVNDAHDVALLVNPNLMFAGGRNFLKEHAPRLTDPLKSLLIPDVSAGLVCMSFMPAWYAEIRISTGGDANITNVLTRMRETIDQLPSHAESFLLSSSPHPSWRALALRLPAMLRAVAASTRVRSDEQQAVANLYLPTYAAPNVLVSSWLAANTPAGETASVAAAPQATKNPLKFAEILNRSIDVAIVEEDMHAAAALIQEIANEGLPPGSEKMTIKLVGTDLEKDGITQNQKLRNFEQRGKPLREILTALCMRAHSPTLTDPKDPGQKLVWALGPSPEDANQKAVLITTRTAATSRYELAPEFGGSPKP